MNKLLSEENKVPEQHLENNKTREMAGSAKYKQSKTV